MFWTLYGAMETGDDELDRIRWPAMLALVRTFGFGVSPAVARAFMAILHNEAAYIPGDPRYPDAAYPAGRDGYYPIGDITARNGPSYGPGQVERVNLERLGFDGDPQELAQVGNESRALGYSAQVFAEGYAAAGGDLPAAVARYNGSGPAADAYASRASDFADSIWGGFVT